MTATVARVLELLQRHGFEQIPRPLTIASTEFDFEAAARGTKRAHDLVLVASDQMTTRRLRMLLSALARSLDVDGSRRPVSLVIVGSSHLQHRRELDAFARVLFVAAEPTERELNRALSVLLPLSLPTEELEHGGDPANAVAGALGPKNSTSEHLRLIAAASHGADGVRAALKSYVEEALGDFEGDEWSE